MLDDAFVYGIGLCAAGRVQIIKERAASFASGVLKSVSG